MQITQIKMFDAHHGWAVAQAGADLVDHILVTADGGSTWQDRTPLNAVGQPASGRFTADVYFGDLQDAWVMFGNSSAPAGDQPLTVWFTKDGGTTWTQSSPLDMSGIPAAFYVPSSLGFLDNQQFGWLLIHLGAGMMHDYIAGFITLDGGANWQIIINPMVNTPLMACPKTGFVFTSQTDGWLTGNCPGLMPTLVFFQSTDGGNVWNPITLPAASDMPAAFSPDQLGNNCGVPSLEITQPGNFMLDLTCINFDLNQASTWLYNSPDGGVTWNSLAASEPYGSFDFLNAQQGWQIGMQINDPSAPAEIFATHDGGSTWEHVINVNWHGDMDFIDAQNGWVVARNGDQIALVYSSDGGKSWQELQPSIGQPQP